MQKRDQVLYLNSRAVEATGFETLHSKLIATLTDLKQARATPAQWIGILNGMTQKGIKGAEIEDSLIIEHLQGFDAGQKVDKDSVIKAIVQRLPYIKRVELGTPRFTEYTNLTGKKYTERLYILSSEGMVADDMIEDLMYRIEDLGFNPAPLLADPTLVDKLESEMRQLKSLRPLMYDFVHHHFSEEAGPHGKNLMAHSRLSQQDDLLLIEEIQSDWAQRGRSQNWNSLYPKAPLVTNTELWAGVVLRDILHNAATDPNIKRVAWIRADMRNGWADRSNLDGLNQFYDTIIRKLAEKCIAKAGGKVEVLSVNTKNGPRDVLGLVLTDSVRQALKQSLPLYSRDLMLPRSTVLDDPTRTQECSRVLQECTGMLGSAHTIRFVAKLYDASHSYEVPGRYLNKGITLSLRAKDLDRAARHEAWHFANENFLMPHEKREMRLAFSFGSDLNNKTRAALIAVGANAAAAQCVDDQECAAHAFSLWCEGKLVINEEKPKSIFAAVSTALVKIADWLEGAVFGVKVQKPEDLFEAMRDGSLALREQMAEQQRAAAPTP